MARKLALIIGNSQYEDAGLAKLAAPDADARALAEVLQSPVIGGFDEVTPLLNQGLATVRKAIARFFDARHRDDLLVLYFSGHGIRDEHGHLYLAVRDTERAVLAGTAIEASYVTTRMDRSASKRLVLVLDCCHSGAFGHGTKSAAGATVGTATAFEGTGRGRVVLTATDSTQYAWEGDQVIGDVENSLFTHYLIEGMRSGAADRDGDGQITIDELYDYAYDHVLSDTPKQTPGKWAFGQQGEIVIARNPGVNVATLPPEIEESLRSTLPSVRFQVLPELYATVRGRHEGRCRAARAALTRLAQDDSRKVASGAAMYLQALERGEVLEVEDWARRVRDREEEAGGRPTVSAQLEPLISAADAALERGALEDVREPLGLALRLDAQDPAVRSLQERFAAAVEERARLEDAEKRIRELRAAIATRIARANATAVHAEAIVLLNEALTLDPEHLEVRQLLEGRHRLAAEAEAQRQTSADAAVPAHTAIERATHVEGQLEEAARHLSRDNLTKAISITEAILRDDPANAAAHALHAKARGAVDAKRLEERAEAEEIRRFRREEGAREKATRERAASSTSESAPGFSSQPTVMAHGWRWLRGSVLHSSTFRMAVIAMVAVGLAWTTLGRAPAPQISAPEVADGKTPPPTTAPSSGRAGGVSPNEGPSPSLRGGSTPPGAAVRPPAQATRPLPAADTESLLRAVQAFEAAVNSGRREAVKTVFPSASEAELRNLDSLRSKFGDQYRMTILVRDARVDGTRGTVVCRIVHSGIDESGKPVRTAANVTWHFTWTGTTWVRAR
jgi:tetratricopeptide (TPR) repeat protein